MNASVRHLSVPLLFSLMLVGCTESLAPPFADGATGDAAGDGGVGRDILGSEGAVALPEAGWIATESGPVKIHDGGVLIVEDGGATYVCQPTTCAGRLLACGDCIDNDGDGKIDFRDPECLGPCDNTEGPALESGVGGVIGEDCHVDCYFDYGNGPGQSYCWWDHACDPLSPEEGCEYDPQMAANEHFCPSTQDEACENYCLPFTPNGCDCFGCCTFPELAGKGEGGADVYVWIGNMDKTNRGTCTLADLSDPTKCPPCTPVDACLNTCGRCEVCVGKPTVPADCFQPSTSADGGAGTTDGGGVVINPEQCAPGVQPCGLDGQAPCPASFYCISGCCKQTIL